MGYMLSNPNERSSPAHTQQRILRSRSDFSEMKKRYFETPISTGGKKSNNTQKSSEGIKTRTDMSMFFCLIMLMFMAVLIPLLFGDHSGP